MTGHGRNAAPSTHTATYLTRGNVTQVTKWLLPSTQISTRMQYDIAGNVTSSTDPLGRTTTLDFSDAFGHPDPNARGNEVPLPSELGGLSTYAFATKVTNAI